MSTGYLATAPLTFIAGADLSAKAGTFGKLNSSGLLVACGAGEVGFPILLGAVSGLPCTVYAPGSIAKMKGGSAIAAGAFIKSDTNGKAEDAAATSVSGAAVLGSNVLGQALSAISNADEIVEVLFLPIGAVVTTAS
jgi:hypothetical protein